MKKLIFLSLFTAALFVNAQDSFVGTSHQKDNDTSYKFTMDRINDTDYKVVYPTLKCSSIWKLKKTDDDYKIYQEKITTGLDKCNDGEYIFVQDDMMGSSTKYFYIYKDVKGIGATLAEGTIDPVE